MEGGKIWEVGDSVDDVDQEDLVFHPLVRAAIERIVWATTSVELRVYRGDVEAEERAPAARIFTRFYPFATFKQALGIIVSDLLVYGNSFWLIETLNGQPDRLYYIPPRAVSLDLNRDMFTLYLADGIKRVSADQLLWFKLPNPADPEGLGVGIVPTLKGHLRALREIDACVSEYLRNAAIPSLLVKVGGKLSHEELLRKQAEIDASLSKRNRYRALVVTENASVNTVETALKLGDLPEVRRVLREEILGAFGVPPFLVGIMEYANYANSRQQIANFWVNTVIPLLVLIEETLNQQLLKRFKGDFWVEFNKRDIPIALEIISEYAQSIVKLVETGVVTINEARELLGIYKPLSWGDAYWGHINTVVLAREEKENV